MIDELELVRASMASVADPDVEVIARLRAHLDALISPATTPPITALSVTPCLGRRATGRRARMAAGAVVALAAAVVALFVIPSAPLGTHPAAASVALTRLAHVAAGRTATTPPSSRQFEYIRSQGAVRECIVPATRAPSSGTSGVDGSSSLAAKEAKARAAAGESLGATPMACALIPSQRQIWIAYDGSGRLVETFGSPIFLSDAERVMWQAAGSPTFPTAPSSVTNQTFGAGDLVDAPSSLAALPTDPSALAARISARDVEGGPSGTAEDFTQIGDLLRDTDASPALRAALYEVAAAMPGVELLGAVALHDGRSGVGVGFTANGIRSELIFDPSSSALLGEQSVATIADPSGYKVAAGTVLGWTEYDQTAVENAVTDSPSGPVPLEPSAPCGSSDPGTAKEHLPSSSGDGPLRCLTPAK